MKRKALDRVRGGGAEPEPDAKPAGFSAARMMNVPATARDLRLGRWECESFGRGFGGAPLLKKWLQSCLERVGVFKPDDFFPEYSFAVVEHGGREAFDAAKLLLQVISRN